MNPVRKKRLFIVLAILAGVGIAVALALSALQQNINLFYTPTQIAAGEALDSPMPTPNRQAASEAKPRAVPDKAVIRLQKPRPIEISRVRFHASARRPSGMPNVA